MPQRSVLANVPVSWLTVETPLPSGPLRVAISPAGVLAASYWDDPLSGLPGPATTPPPDPALAALVADRLREYFAGERQELGLPVDWRLSTGVQRTVLETLHRTVPYGSVVTYGQLAARSGLRAPDTPGGEPPARTVGTIMGANPVPLLVPCHRVVASDGIGGFGRRRDGVEVKRWLLTLEGVLAPTLEWNGP